MVTSNASTPSACLLAISFLTVAVTISELRMHDFVLLFINVKKTGVANSVLPRRDERLLLHPTSYSHPMLAGAPPLLLGWLRHWSFHRRMAVLNFTVKNSKIPRVPSTFQSSPSSPKPPTCISLMALTFTLLSTTYGLTTIRFLAPVQTQFEI